MGGGVVPLLAGTYGSLQQLQQSIATPAFTNYYDDYVDSDGGALIPAIYYSVELSKSQFFFFCDLSMNKCP